MLSWYQAAHPVMTKKINKDNRDRTFYRYCEFRFKLLCFFLQIMDFWKIIISELQLKLNYWELEQLLLRGDQNLPETMFWNSGSFWFMILNLLEPKSFMENLQPELSTTLTSASFSWFWQKFVWCWEFTSTFPVTLWAFRNQFFRQGDKTMINNYPYQWKWISDHRNSWFLTEQRGLFARKFYLGKWNITNEQQTGRLINSFFLFSANHRCVLCPVEQ